MTDKEKLQRYPRLDAIYRFWRRYLGKFHPEIYKEISVELLLAEEIIKKEREMVKS